MQKPLEINLGMTHTPAIDPLLNTPSNYSPTDSNAQTETAASKAKGRGTKRPRPVLSCTACIRRKSKCDRCIPCGACLKRNQANLCKVVDEEAERTSQPFALASELSKVQRRLDDLEARFRIFVPGAAAHDLIEPPRDASHGQGAPTAERSATNGSDVEAAAFALEEIALGHAGRYGIGSDLANEVDVLAGEGDAVMEPLTSSARSKIAQIRALEIELVVSMLPDWELAQELIDGYKTRVAWSYSIIDFPDFERNYEVFRSQIVQKQFSSLDLPFVALYLMILSCSIFFTPPTMEYDVDKQSELAHTWFAGSQRALDLADWSGQPNLTNIQTIVHMPILLMHSGGIKRLASWIAAAIRTAQLLGIHAYDGGSKDDSQLQSDGTVNIEKELGRRLYYTLLHAEANFTKRWLGLGDSHLDQVVPNLLNADDDFVPRPIETPTTSSYLVVRSQIMSQGYFKLLNRASKRSYDSVLEFDRITRELFTKLPKYYQLERSDDPDIKALTTQKPYIAIQRATLLLGLQTRLMRCHRPWLVSGYFDARYRYSTDACVKSAKMVLATHRALRLIFDGAERMYNGILYSLSAAVVLLVDNFHSLSIGTVTEELNLQRSAALDVLQRFRRQEAVSTLAKACTRVLEGLLTEEGRRRAIAEVSLPAELRMPSEHTNEPSPGHEQEERSLKEIIEHIAASASIQGRQNGHQNGQNSKLPPLSRASTRPQTNGTHNHVAHKQQEDQYANYDTSMDTTLNASMISEANAPYYSGQWDTSNLFLQDSYLGLANGQAGDGTDLLRSLGLIETEMDDGAGVSKELSWLDNLTEGF